MEVKRKAISVDEAKAIWEEIGSQCKYQQRGAIMQRRGRKIGIKVDCSVYEIISFFRDNGVAIDYYGLEDPKDLIVTIYMQLAPEEEERK